MDKHSEAANEAMAAANILVSRVIETLEKIDAEALGVAREGIGEVSIKGVTPISQNTMSIKRHALSMMNWSPNHYDADDQVATIKEIISSVMERPGSARHQMEAILEKGKCLCEGDNKNPLVFHSEVILACRPSIQAAIGIATIMDMHKLSYQPEARQRRAAP